MTPSVGRIVHVVGPSAQSNGSTVAPGIITCVRDDQTVNVTLFPDNGVPAVATSVTVHDSEADARGAVSALGNPYAAFWPPRV